MTSSLMTMSRNGQVSIPAATRARWKTNKIVVVDMGDYVVMRPASGDPVSSLKGKYAGKGPSTTEMRRQERAEEARQEKRGR